MTKKYPSGIRCSQCGIRFANFLELAKHIIENKQTHSNPIIQECASRWVILASEVKVCSE